MLYPLAFKKVFAIFPPIKILSTPAFSIKLVITPILSETFAPPRIATNGFSGLFNTAPSSSTSFSIKKPKAVSFPCSSIFFATPSVELCALWALPKASFTYPSAKSANSADKTSSFLVSLASKRVFSTSPASPSFNSLIIPLALSPVVSPANFTSFPNSSDSLSATGFKEYFAFISSADISFGFGLPKWEQRTTFTPWSIKYWIVGIAALILVSSWIFPSFIGTLKSQRTKIAFPFTSISLTVFFSMPLFLLL